MLKIPQSCLIWRPMNSGSELLGRITFGRFCVVPHHRELLSNDRPIMLGGRAFDVLMALIEAHGSVVSTDALMARVWPNRVVEENNLAVQISMLRAAFGAERALIRTVPRRGYQFTGKVRFPAENVEGGVDAHPISPEPGLAAPATNLPQPVSELIGRDDSLLEILSLALSHRTRNAHRRWRNWQDTPCPRRRAPVVATIRRRGLDC